MTPAEADFREAAFYHLSRRGRGISNRMNAMRLPVKGEERREKGVSGLLFRPALGKTLFVSAEPLPTDGFTFPSSPFTLPTIASCDCPGRGITKFRNSFLSSYLFATLFSLPAIFHPVFLHFVRAKRDNTCLPAAGRNFEAVLIAKSGSFSRACPLAVRSHLLQRCTTPASQGPSAPFSRIRTTGTP